MRAREAPIVPGVWPASWRDSRNTPVSLATASQAIWGPKSTPSVRRAALRVAPTLCAPISSGGRGRWEGPEAPLAAVVPAGQPPDLHLSAAPRRLLHLTDVPRLGAH